VLQRDVVAIDAGGEALAPSIGVEPELGRVVAVVAEAARRMRLDGRAQHDERLLLPTMDRSSGASDVRG
jgi:hypothetical protein